MMAKKKRKRAPAKNLPGTIMEDLRLLGRAVEQCSEGVAIVDLKGNIIFVNRAFASMHGYGLDELIGKHLSIFHSSKQLPSVKAANRKIQDTGEFIGEIWHIRKDGTEFPSAMHNSLLRDESGAPTGMIATLRDITEQKQADQELDKYRRTLEEMVEERTARLKSSNLELRRVIKEQRKIQNSLAESEHRWQSLWENIPDIVLTVSRKGDILSINRTLKGLSREEVLGSSIYQYIPPQYVEKAKKTISRVLRTGKPVISEVLGAGSEGPESGWYETQAVPIKSDGETMVVTLICTDITRRKKAQEYLKNSEKQLKEQKKALEEKNIALREVLEQLEIEKKQIRDGMAAAVEKLVIPALHKIRKTGARPSDRALDTLERNLKKLASPFDLGFSDPRLKLTPREIEICDLIQSGLPNKEISRVLHLSRATVEKHRENIRKKFGISRKKINLRSFLHNM